MKDYWWKIRIKKLNLYKKYKIILKYADLKLLKIKDKMHLFKKIKK